MAIDFSKKWTTTGIADIPNDGYDGSNSCIERAETACSGVASTEYNACVQARLRSFGCTPSASPEKRTAATQVQMSARRGTPLRDGFVPDEELSGVAETDVRDGVRYTYSLDKPKPAKKKKKLKKSKDGHKAHVLEDYRSIKSDAIDVSDVFSSDVVLSQQCNTAQFNAMYPEAVASKLGLSQIPLGYGPNCNPSKEQGEKEARICYHDAYMGCVVKFLEDQKAAAERALEVAETNHANRLDYEADKRLRARGAKGIAVSQPFHELAIPFHRVTSVEECMSALTYQGDDPVDWRQDTRSVTRRRDENDSDKQATDTEPQFCLDTAVVPKQNTVDIITDINPLAAQSGVAKYDQRLNVRRLIRSHVMEALGPAKGELTDCSCSKCLVVQNKSYDSSSTEGAQAALVTAALERKANTSPDDLIATSEAESVGVILPYVVGRIIIRGTVITVDEEQAAACGLAHPRFDCVVKLAANRVDKVVRILRLGADVTNDVAFELFYTADGHSAVRMFGVPKEWLKAEGTLDVVFDTYTAVELVPTVKLRSDIAVSTRSTVVRADMRRVYVNTTTNAVDVYSIVTGAKLETLNVIINAGDVWDVTPVGDVVIKRNGTGDVDLYIPATDTLKTFANVVNPATADFSYSLSGAVNLVKSKRYQYETLRGNPRAEFDTWIPLKAGEAYTSAYNIHSNHGSDTAKVISVPAHVIDADLADAQTYYKDVFPGGELRGGVSVDEYGSDVFILHNENSFSITVAEFAKNYTAANAPLIDTVAAYAVDYDFNSNLKTGMAAHSRTTYLTPQRFFTRDNGVGQVLFSPEYQKLVVNDGANWFIAEHRLSLFEAGLFNSANASVSMAQSYMKQINAPQPAARVTLSVTSDSRISMGREAVFQYIDTNGDMIEFDVANDTWRKVGVVNEARNITSQTYTTYDGGTVIYTTDDGAVNAVTPNSSAVFFDVAAGLVKMFSFLGIKANAVDSVPSFLTGFALIGDSTVELLKNLYYATGVVADFNTGTDVVEVRKAETLKLDIQQHKYYRDHIIFADEPEETPTVDISYLEPAHGVRELYTRTADTSKLLSMKTNASVWDIASVVDNAQELAKRRSDGDTIVLSVAEALASPYEDITFDTAKFSAGVEQRYRDGLVKYPSGADALLIFTTDAAASADVARPVFDGTDTLNDIGQLNWGKIATIPNSFDLTFTAYGTADAATLNTAKGLFGLRNNEWILFDAAVHVSGNTYTLQNARRGVHHSHYARDFNIRYADNDKDDGVWLVRAVPDTYALPAKPAAIDNAIVLPQHAMSAQVPLQTRFYNKIPAPTNIVVGEDVISWTSQNIIDDRQLGTGEYIVGFFWGYMRDGMDALYLLNTLSRTNPESYNDVLYKGENRFLHAKYVTGTDMLFPKDYKANLVDSITKHTVTPIDIPDTSIPFQTDNGWWFYSDTEQAVAAALTALNHPAYWKGFVRGTSPAHPAFYEWMKRLLVPSYNGWHWTWDGAGDVIQVMPELPKLTGLYDYYGDGAKNPGKVVYPAADVGKLAETWFPAFPVPSTVFPIRHFLSLFLYKLASQRFPLVDVALNRTEYHNPNTTLYNEPGGMPRYSSPFTEKLHVARILLDQFYGVQTPSAADKTLLNEYGLGGLYTLQTHDAASTHLNALVNEALYKDTEHYLALHNAEKIGIIIAEVQTDGTLGHFELLEGVAPAKKHEWCVTDRLNNSAKVHKSTTYALIEELGVGCSMFSMTLVVPKYTPPVNAMRVRKATTYAAIVRESNRLLKTGTYCAFAPKA